MKISILGDVCIDKNRVEGAEYEFFGGPAMYTNLILSKFADVEVQIFTNHSSEFTKYSKGLNLFPKVPNVETNLVYQNIVEKGKRTQYAENRREDKFSIDLEKMAEEVSNTEVFIFAPLLPVSINYIEKVIDIIPKSATKVVLPQGYFRQFDEENKVSFREFEEAEELLKLFDYIILSKEDYPNLDELSKDWSKDFGIKALLTLEERGAEVFENGIGTIVGTIPIETIKDSTGSGDIFSGSFIYYKALGNDDETSIKFANRIAGKCLAFTPSEIAELELVDLLT